MKDVGLPDQYVHPYIYVATKTKYMTADDINNAIAAILETFEMMSVLLQPSLVHN